MGKKRYYCDFCDKHFADNPQTRRKHMQGIQHATARRAHYARFKEPDEILAENSNKQKCRRFMQTGECDYGDGCRYSHITPEKQQELITRVQAKRLLNQHPMPTVEEWLEKYHKAREGNSDNQNATNHDDQQPQLPEILKGIPNLPPSLIPPERRPTLPSIEWG